MSKKNTFQLILVSLMIVLPLLTSCAAPAPQVVEKVVTQMVEKTVVQTVQVEVPKEVVQTVEVEKVVTVEVPVKRETVTIVYNGYFEKTFGPAKPPIDAIREEVAKKYPNIDVKLNIMPYEAGPWRDNYLAWFQAEDGNTDLIGMGLYWLPEFAKTGWLMPLNDVISPDILKKLKPSYLDAFTADGKLLALGPWWGGIGGLYYRKDLLEAAGIQPPATYEELVAAATEAHGREPRHERLDLARAERSGPGQPVGRVPERLRRHVFRRGRQVRHEQQRRRGCLDLHEEPV